MVAFQKAEYGPNGEILPPREKLMELNWEPNGSFSSESNAWHRHSLSANSQREFDQKLNQLKRQLAAKGADVYRVDTPNQRNADVYYLIEDKQLTAKMQRIASEGKQVPQLEASPYLRPGYASSR